MNNNSFFSSEHIETPIKKLKQGHYRDRVERNNLILDVIRIHYPLSKYKLAKITGLSYNCIKQITKEFEFCGLIFIKSELTEVGNPVKMIYLKLEDKNENY